MCRLIAKLIMEIFCDADNYDDELIDLLKFEYNHKNQNI